MVLTATETIETYYASLIPSFLEYPPDEVLYLITDFSFAADPQIWTEKDKADILDAYARQAASVVDGLEYDEALKRLKDNFDSSREIYSIQPKEFGKTGGADEE